MLSRRMLGADDVDMNQIKLAVSKSVHSVMPQIEQLLLVSVTESFFGDPENTGFAQKFEDSCIPASPKRLAISGATNGRSDAELQVPIGMCSRSNDRNPAVGQSSERSHERTDADTCADELILSSTEGRARNAASDDCRSIRASIASEPEPDKNESSVEDQFAAAQEPSESSEANHGATQSSKQMASLALKKKLDVYPSVSMVLAGGELFDRTTWLDVVSSFVIVCNAFVVAVSVDVASEWHGWLAIESAFIAYFVFELICRLVANGAKLFFCGQDRIWNCMDAILVTLAMLSMTISIAREIIESKGHKTGVVTTLRLLRLLRLIRIIRLLQSQMLNTLLLMLKGILSMASVLCWAMIILLVVIGTLGLLLRQTLGRSCTQDAGADISACQSDHLKTHSDALFSTFPRACFTVFRCLTEGCASIDGTPLLVQIVEIPGSGPVVVFIYCVVYIFVTFGLFNLILAILVDSTMKAARKCDSRDLDRLRIASELRSLLSELCEHSLIYNEETGAMEISKQVLDEILSDHTMLELLDDLEVPTQSTTTLFETLDADGSGTLDLDEFIDAITRFQSSARNDVAALVAIKALQKDLKAVAASIDNRFQPCQEQIVLLGAT